MDENIPTQPATPQPAETPADPIVTMETVIKPNGRKTQKSVIDPGDSLNGLGFMFSFIPLFCYPAFIVSSVGVKRSRKAGHKGVLGILGMLISGFWLFIVPFTLLFIVSTTPVDKIIPQPVIQTIAGIANSNPALSGVLNGLAGTAGIATPQADPVKTETCTKIVDTITAVGNGRDITTLPTTLHDIAANSQDPEMITKINTITAALTNGTDPSSSLTDLALYCSDTITSIK